MLAATHRLYQFFSHAANVNAIQGLTFLDFTSLLFKQTSIAFDCPLSENDRFGDLSQSETCILKVLTQAPFTQYEPLRKLSFKWTLRLLDDLIEKLETKFKARDQIMYADLDHLKFLLRRATLMNSNYLVSFKMICFLKKLLDDSIFQQIEVQINNEFGKAAEAASKFDGAKTAIEDLNELKKEKLRNYRNFHVFVCAQIKELLLANEIRSPHLERIIKKVGSGSAVFNQVIRILCTENAMIIHNFYEYLTKIEGWGLLFKNHSGDNDIDETNAPIKQFLQKVPIQYHPRFRNLRSFFDAIGDNLGDSLDLFSNYLWIQYFVSHDKYNDFLSLKGKTNYIFSKLRDLLDYSGAFLIIRDSQKRFYLVHNKNSDDLPELDEANWNNEKDKYLVRFIKGIEAEPGTYYKSIVELDRDPSSKRWIDTYSVSAGTVIDDLSITFLPQDMKRLVLMRLSRRDEKGNDKIQGLVGFYYHRQSTQGTDKERLLYLLLLRNTLGSFVKNHHQNSEFSDWRIAESYRKLTLLAGHGRYMLQKLSTIDPDLFLNIVLNMEHLQMIIMLDQSVTRKNHEDTDIKRRFNQFYHVKGQKTLTTSYFGDVEILANRIYTEREIECEVDCFVDVLKPPASFRFAFNKQILDIIFFELILNAKKNRWHFLNKEAVEGKTRNELLVVPKVETTRGKRKLLITITNTGPKVEDSVIALLNDKNKNVKPEDSTSGTALIKTLVRSILGGQIHFKCTPVGSESSIHLFKVTITLNEMENTNEQATFVD
jgi:hypothetical protein